MIVQLSQISLVTGIMELVEKQARERGIKNLPTEAHQVNAIIAGANLIAAAYQREKRVAPPGAGVRDWLASEDTGSSSKAIVANLFGAGGVRVEDMKAHPLDPDDFGRCHRMLEVVPQARPRLSEMASVSEVWARLVAHWDELTALYLKDLPTGRWPELYRRMKELGC